MDEDSSTAGSRAPEVVVWSDPVCPYSWATVRWLRELAAEGALRLRWELMSLAVLNEGRELPPPGQQRMRDSRLAGRLFTSLGRELDEAGMWSAYTAFGDAYFERGAVLDDALVHEVVEACSADDAHAESLADDSLDAAVRSSHERGQRALGETGGSPITSVDGAAFFGPVLTSLPGGGAGRALFGAVATLAAIPEFSQLQRPRSAHH